MKRFSILEQFLTSHKVIICCGCGGVGKTTISAALGIKAAQLGRKVIVITVDPARRLADSLGVKELTDEPKPVLLPQEVNGQMYAMMLDVKNTLDQSIQDFADTAEQAEKILKNPIYNQFSQHFGGAQEYGGIGRLHQINQENQYDLIVLDTPPSQHALDFVTAPSNLKHFFQDSVLRYFVKADEEGSQQILLSKGSDITLRVLSKLTGSHFIQNLSDFVHCLQGMHSSLSNLANQVLAILTGDATAFFVVTSLDPIQVRETRMLHQALKELNLLIQGVFVNRCTPSFGFSETSVVSTDYSKELRSLIQNHLETLYHEDLLYRQLLREMKEVQIQKRIPAFLEDIHNAETLMKLADTL